MNLEKSIDNLKKEYYQTKKSNSEIKENKRSRYNSFSLIESDEGENNPNIIKNLFGKPSRNNITIKTEYSEKSIHNRSPLKYYSNSNLTSSKNSDFEYQENNNDINIIKKIGNIHDLIVKVCNLMGNKLEKTISKIRSINLSNLSSFRDEKNEQYKDNKEYKLNINIDSYSEELSQLTPIKEKNENNSDTSSIGRKRLILRSNSIKKEMDDLEFSYLDKFMNYTVTPVKKSKSANILNTVEKSKIETEFLMNKLNTLNLDEYNIQQSNKICKNNFN